MTVVTPVECGADKEDPRCRRCLRRRSVSHQAGREDSSRMRRTISVQVDLGVLKRGTSIDEESEEDEDSEPSNRLQFDSSSSTTSTDVNDSAVED